MNQAYKSRYSQMLESNTSDISNERTEEIYENSGMVKNLYIEWPNGECRFFSYSSLERGDFYPGEEKNTIILFFFSTQVVIHGYLLKPLHLALFDHIQRLIVINDPRYAIENKTCVVEVIVEDKEK